MKKEILTLKIIDQLKLASLAGQKPAFIFDRISDKPDESKSLEFQDYHALRYASDNDLFIAHSFTVTETGYKNEERKIFKEMLDLSEKFGIKNLIFKNSDRLSRNLEDLLRIQKLYEEHDYNIHFFESYQIINKDSSYDEKWTLEMLILIAKRHSDKISHDIKASNLYKAEKGIAPGRSPIGYRYDKEKRIHYIDKNIENQIRWMFDEYDTGNYSLSTFIDKLNSKNIKTINGNTWKKSQLEFFLKNPFYHGEFYYQDKIWQGNHEAYYEKERFEKRLRKLKGRGHPRGLQKRTFLLSNIIQCPCGLYYYGDFVKSKYTYYVHKCKDRNGRQLSILERKFFTLIDKEINEIQLFDDFTVKLKEIFKDLVQIKRKNKKSELLNITKRIQEIEFKKDKFYNLYADEDINKDDLKRNLTQLEKEIKKLNKQRELLSNDQEDFVFKVSEVIDDFKNFPSIFKQASYELKAKMLCEVAERIVLDGDSLSIYWKKPFSILIKPELFHLQEKVRVCQEMLPR